jgi:hypothetical protein
LCKHMTIKATRKRRKKSKKCWKPVTDLTAEAFNRKLEYLSESSPSLESFHSRLTSLVQDTLASTRTPGQNDRPNQRLLCRRRNWWRMLSILLAQCLLRDE